MHPHCAADFHVGSNADIANQPASSPDSRIGSDPTMWADTHLFTDLGGGIDRSGRMNSFSGIDWTLEQFQQPGQSQPGTGNQDVVWDINGVYLGRTDGMGRLVPFSQAHTIC